MPINFSEGDRHCKGIAMDIKEEDLGAQANWIVTHGRPFVNAGGSLIIAGATIKHDSGDMYQVSGCRLLLLSWDEVETAVRAMSQGLNICGHYYPHGTLKAIDTEQHIQHVAIHKKAVRLDGGIVICGKAQGTAISVQQGDGKAKLFQFPNKLAEMWAHVRALQGKTTTAVTF